MHGEGNSYETKTAVDSFSYCVMALFGNDNLRVSSPYDGSSYAIYYMHI